MYYLLEQEQEQAQGQGVTGGTVLWPATATPHCTLLGPTIAHPIAC